MWRQFIQGVVAFVVVMWLAAWMFITIHFVTKYW